MADKDNQIAMSQDVDQKTYDLQDYVPEQLIRVYPYRAIYGDDKKRIVSANTNTIVRLNQSDVDDFINLQIDENGNYYFEMFAAVSEKTTLTVKGGASKVAQQLRKIKSFTAITTNYFETNEDKPDFFVIGEPFDEKKYKDREQAIYFGENFTPAYREVIEELADQGFNIEETHRISEIELVDISELEKAYENAAIQLTTNVGLFTNPTITFEDNDGNTVTKPGFRIAFDKQTLFQTIKAKGELESVDPLGNVITATENDIDLVSSEPLVPFSATPVIVQDKTVMKMNWFNGEEVMPWTLAEQFDKVGGLSLSEISSTQIDFSQPKLTATTSNITGGLASQKAVVQLDKSKITNGIPYGVSFELTYQLGLDPSQTTQSPSVNSVGLLPEYTLTGFTGKLKTSYDDSTGELTLSLPYEPPYAYEFTKVVVKYADGSKTIKVLEEEDIKLIEDMLIISAGFADNKFIQSKIITKTDQAAYGKLDGSQRIGWGAYRMSMLANESNPGNLINGLFMTHMNTYPTFRENRERYFTVKSVINALSKYIFSNTLAIAQGGNELNSVVLPYYLELADGRLDYYINAGNNVVSRVSEEADDRFTTGIVETTLLRGASSKYKDENKKEDGLTDSVLSDIKFKLKSNYLKENYRSDSDYRPYTSSLIKPNMDLPFDTPMSNPIVLEAEAKILFPEVEDHLTSVNYPVTPGENVGSKKDLSYVWQIPMKKREELEGIMSGLFQGESLKTGDVINVNIPTGTKEAEEYVSSVYGEQGVTWRWAQVPTKNIVFPASSSAVLKNGNVHMINIRENTANKGLQRQDNTSYFLASEIGTGKIYPESLTNEKNFNKRWDDGTAQLPFLGTDGVTYNFRWLDQGSREQKLDMLWYILSKGSNPIPRELLEMDAAGDTYKISKNTHAGYTGGNETTYSVDMNGTFSFKVGRIEFTGGQIEILKDVGSVQPPTDMKDRQIFFDKNQWKRFVGGWSVNHQVKETYNLYEQYDQKINQLDEIDVYGVWGSEIEIWDDNTDRFVIPMNNEIDGSIAIQRIVIF